MAYSLTYKLRELFVFVFQESWTGKESLMCCYNNVSSSFAVRPQSLLKEDIFILLFYKLDDDSCLEQHWCSTWVEYIFRCGGSIIYIYNILVFLKL